MSRSCGHGKDVTECSQCNDGVTWRGTLRRIAHGSHRGAFEGQRPLCGTGEATIFAASPTTERCTACLDALASMRIQAINSTAPTTKLADRLRAQSDLGELGYNISKLDREHPWRLLKVAVEAYGAAHIISLLDGHVELRMKQRNGAMHYAHAIREWHHDIERLRNEYLR